MPRIRLPHRSKLAINQKNDKDVTVFRHDIIVNFFDVAVFPFSYWFKFHTNIITGSGVAKTVYKGLTRNPEILLSEFCPISGDWGELGIPNLV